MSSPSLCIRCGKERIVQKTWDEYVGESLITVTQYVCPDKECQKKVDEEFKKKKDHINAIHEKSEARKKENRRNKKPAKK